jgi:inhibitor of cysteine peptidase
MISKNNVILLSGGIVAGVIIAMFAFSIFSIPAEKTSPVPAFPVAAHGGQALIASENLPRFTSETEILPFLRSHTDLAGNYPELQTVETGVPEPVELESGNGTRTWTFDVDTSAFRPDEYLVTANAVLYEATGTALFNVIENGQQKNPLTGQITGLNRGKDGYFIHIDPISDRWAGEKFTITGTTNLPKDAELLVEVYSSSFKPTQKSQSGEFSGSTGTIRVSGSQGTIAASSSSENRKHSDTNVQVKGVDEADIIRTDGTIIYTVTGNTLQILRAYPADSAGILATQGFSGTPLALYITGDRLTLIVSQDDQKETWSCKPGSCANRVTRSPVTKIFIFSVRDPANPALLRETEIDGQYKDSRMIGSELYFITTKFTDNLPGSSGFPEIRDSAKGSSVLPLYYFDRKDRAFSMTSVGAFDVSTTGDIDAQAFLVGSAGTVYVSTNHLYIAISSYGDSQRRDSTEIYAFAIGSGHISYGSRGTVDGTLLNQFSMDEYGGNLRVATTVQDRAPGVQTTYSKVSVLDGDLTMIGSAGNIAPTEKIYAARFIGDRLYLVTFRQTDPFYVIDLENPRQPKVLGELKIPGFSNYLHPYDATKIIGIGKESASGALKMALFDVEDVKNPKLISEERLGDAGSDSEVLRDHKAFLFDPERNLLVLPVSLIITPVYRPDRPYTGPTSWGGAYVYTVDPVKGFSLKGTVEHYSGEGGAYPAVKRSLYIEDILYTMSPDTIVMSDLKNNIRRINSIALG